MISSTSSSEVAIATSWRRWPFTFAAVLATALLVIWFFLLSVDPYDSGRFPGLRVSGIVDRNPRTANAGRARNPLFNAAVLGNSTGQLLDPVRLSAATALRFVQLTVPGTGPREQITLLRYFISHHQHPAAVVIIADPTWCTSDPSLPLEHPFPFWLYGSNNLDYLRHLASWHALELGFRRVGLALGLRRPVARIDGFSDYEMGADPTFNPNNKLETDGTAGTAAADLTPMRIAFPGIDRLDRTATDLPRQMALIVVIPPVFAEAIPPAHSPFAMRLQQCSAALAKTVVGRSRGGFLDFRADNAMTRDPANFIDVRHYRANLARQIERSVSAIIVSDTAGPKSEL